MVNPLDFIQWIVGVCLLFAIPALIIRLYDRREHIAWALERYAARAAARRPDEPLDPDVEDLIRALRRERLQADYERLRHLITVDESMSATRQIGNRLAFRQVRQECAAEFGRLSLEQAFSSWGDPYRAVPASQLSAPADDDRRYRPRVETLEIRWR